MHEFLSTLGDRKGQLLSTIIEHIQISFIALLIATIIAVPLGILLTKTKKISEIVMNIAAVLQTIPSLALLGLMIPIFGIGRVPAIIVLVVYALLPILRNTYTGIEEVDPSLVEAAKGIGMKPLRRLTKVELPIAMPVIMAGIRTAMVLIIGTATLTLGLLFIGMNKISDGLNPLIVGGLIVAIGLSLGGPTGYAINPARDLGPRIAHAILPIAGKGKSNWSYAIVPVLGPITGGMIGAVIYRLFYKGAFDTMSVVAIVLLIVTIALGVVLNKAKSAKGIESVY